MADTSYTIVSKKRVVSPVWDYFEFHADNEGKVIDEGVAICRRCSSNARASGRNTLNLLSHLKTHHPSQCTQVPQSQKSKAKENKKPSNASSSSATNKASIPELLTRVQKYEKYTRQWRKITDSVAFCISKDMLSIYAVEKEGFRRLVDPRYEMPSAKYFSNTVIPALFKKTREREVSKIFLSHYGHVIQLNNGTILELFNTFH